MFGREIRDPRSAQELLDEALNVASQADVIVAAVGESSEMSGESSSRTNLEMPDAQRDLLTALKKTGKPIVLVYFAGRINPGKIPYRHDQIIYIKEFLKNDLTLSISLLHLPAPYAPSTL